MEKQPEVWWSPTGPRDAARWERDPLTGEPRNAGYVMYGEVTASRVRSLKVRDWDPTTYQLVTKDPKTDAPPEQVVALAWVRSQEARQQADSETADVYVQPKRPGEPIEAFYARMGLAYAKVRDRHPRRPVVAFSDVLSRSWGEKVTPDRAAYYVREIKRREKGEQA